MGRPRLISRPDAMAAKPTVEPTDKSMPPVRITKVMPTAMIALMAVWPTRMIRFCAVKKDGESIEKTPISTNKAINALNRKSRTPRDKPDGLAGKAAAEDEGVCMMRSLSQINLIGVRGWDVRFVDAHRQQGLKPLRLLGHGGTRP